MMEQEEVIKDGQETAVSSGSTDKEKEVNEKEAQRKQCLYNIFVWLFLGSLFSFAPQYMQTHITWIVFVSGFLFSVCLAISIYHLLHYMDLVRHDDVRFLNLILVAGIFAAIGFYIIPVSDGKPFSNPDSGVWFRGMSFLGILLTVFILLARLPEYIDFYKRNKDTVKAHFTVKNILAAIGAVIVFLTALFQFLQILLQIIR